VFGNQIKIGNFSNAVLEKASFCSLDVPKIFPYCSPDYFYPNPKITLKSDIWTIGILSCELWTKCPGTPFLKNALPGCQASKDLMLNLNLTTNVVYINENQVQILSLEQFHFLETCLKQNFESRPSVNDLLTHASIKEKNVLFE